MTRLTSKWERISRHGICQIKETSPLKSLCSVHLKGVAPRHRGTQCVPEIANTISQCLHKSEDHHMSHCYSLTGISKHVGMTGLGIRVPPPAALVLLQRQPLLPITNALASARAAIRTPCQRLDARLNASKKTLSANKVPPQ